MAETRLGSRPIALVGIAGSGKSAVARRLAAELGGSCVSLDVRITEAARSTIAELFAREGEAAFREHEVRELARAVAEAPAVIDCGGGVVLDPRNRTLLKDRCRTVWLDVSLAEALRRIGPRIQSRPLLAGPNPEAALERQLADRRPLYKEVATWRAETGSRPVAEVVKELMRRIEDLR